MTCIECGMPIARQQRHCPHCGNANVFYSANAESSQTNLTQRPKKGARKDGLFYALIIAVALSVIVTVVATNLASKLFTNYPFDFLEPPTFDHAVAITPGSSRLVNITTTATYVVFAFTPTVSGQYVLHTETATHDPYVVLFDADGKRLADHDDQSSDYNFRLVYDYTAGQTYFFVVMMSPWHSADFPDTGSFFVFLSGATLSLTPEHRPVLNTERQPASYTFETPEVCA